MVCSTSACRCPAATQAAAERGHLRGLMAFATLVILSVALQGCSFDIPRHIIGNWQRKPNYFNVYNFTPPGTNQTMLNSCQSTSVQNLQCNGHGRCVQWFNATNATYSVPSLMFCQCDEYWADPECRTQRKSQLTAFLLSLFFGMFGADQFYLGFWWPHGIIKLFTLGGLGFWWLYDLVRIGSTPVDTVDKFQVAGNVEHWAFVLILLTFFFVIGFGLSIWSMRRHRVAKAREVMLLRADQSIGNYGGTSASGRGPASFRGYATTLQANQA